MTRDELRAKANDLPLLAVADIVRWRERQEGRA